MNLEKPASINQLTDHLFRHESGKMVSVLTKIFGPENLETAEDVVQQTFMDAIQLWKFKGVPENPSAWLFKVAKNKAIDVVRKNKYSRNYDFNDRERILLTSEYTLASTMDKLWNEDLVQDDMLRMMFACCHAEISTENQITLILKTLCGFSTAEIAKTFLTSEDTVSKRLYRTKEFFREQKIKFVIPSNDELQNRTEAVLNSIYLLFNEGYSSTHSNELIRKDLIDEAMLLCKLLLENKRTQLPQCYALMALMCFHAARSESRISATGEIILLPVQDRSTWNFELIARGNEYMNQAAFGDAITSYHLEAAIAYEHCIAPNFEKTNWLRILDLYNWLCKIAPSPVAELNKVVALLQVEGALAAKQQLTMLAEDKKMHNFYLYHSLLGEINALLLNSVEAKKNFETAMQLSQSVPERKILRDKIHALLN